MDEVLDAVQPATRALATTPAETTPYQLIQQAISANMPVETMERLFALHERHEANEARKAYVQAMTAFKENPPEIFKRKLVSFGDTKYSHATLGDVTTAIMQGLAEHGITHRWDTHQEGGRIVVTCVLTHKLGHSEQTTLEGSPDGSGKKNPIQQVASTVTYLQRYTLLAASGIATKDVMDDDGRSAGGSPTDAGGVGQWAGELDAGREAAMQGTAALTKWWGALGKDGQKALQQDFGQMRKAAREADDRG